MVPGAGLTKHGGQPPGGGPPGQFESTPVWLQRVRDAGGVVGVPGFDGDRDLDPAETEPEALPMMLDQEHVAALTGDGLQHRGEVARLVGYTDRVLGESP